MEIYTARSLRGAAGSWSSGYDIALTQRRSPVRIRSSPFLSAGPGTRRPRTGLRMGRGRRERGDEFHGFVILFRESAFQRLPGDVRHADHARGHVGAVDARLRVERRAVKRIGVERCTLEREVLAEVQMLVLECLDAQERDPE